MVGRAFEDAAFAEVGLVEGRALQMGLRRGGRFTERVDRSGGERFRTSGLGVGRGGGLVRRGVGAGRRAARHGEGAEQYAGQGASGEGEAHGGVGLAICRT